MFGRHKGATEVVAGAYASEFGAADEIAETRAAVDKSAPRRPRIYSLQGANRV